MSYIEIPPHPALKKYISTYWLVESDGEAAKRTAILPDGCVDIIINLEDDYKTQEGVILMKSETVYLIGTMTQVKETLTQSRSKLLGIRFKPAAFSLFYTYSSLHEVTNTNVELERNLAPDIQQIKKHKIAYLDQFFLDRLSVKHNVLMPVIEDIYHLQGQMKINELAQRHCTTVKQLERRFKYDVGTSPKEFMNLVRYFSTSQQIKNNIHGKSLAQIAYETGYYDHAHLTKEIKKYSGAAPSKL